MPQYIVKNDTGTFPPGSQPDGFQVLSALENRFFICESPSQPLGDFVIAWPEEQQAKYPYYQHPNGRKLWWDPFDGAVQFGAEIDSKNRRKIIYNEEQLQTQLEIMKWLCFNLWIPDKQRMYQIAENIVNQYIFSVHAILDAEELRTYIRKNLYYNL